MKKVIAIFILIIVFCFFILLNSLSLVNTVGRVLSCQYNLKDIWQYVEQYREDWGGSFPQSLSQLSIYAQGSLPICPGDRNKDETSRSWDYCYLAPKDNEIKPLCWDSETHHYKYTKPYKRNVIFTDGHFESLDEKEFFQLMKKFGISEPDNTFSKYEPPTTASLDIEPVAHRELLDILEHKDLSEIEILRKEFYQYPIQQQLETIVYTLSEGVYVEKSIQLITGNRELHNTSFAKYFPKNISNLKDRSLYDAVNIINNVFPPDPAFIPVLLDHAIESDYVASQITLSRPSQESITFTIFKTTSQVLYKISNKKVGMSYIPDSLTNNEYKKEELIKQWRDTYETSIKPDLIKKGIISE